MITVSEPAFKVVVLRDLDVSYPSGVKSITLEPEDTLTFGDDGNISVLNTQTGELQVFLGRNMECYRLAERAHRRKVEEVRTEAKP